MKTYKINGGFDGEQTVKATSYGIQDGYFHFAGEDKTRVFSIKTERVETVERTED